MVRMSGNRRLRSRRCHVNKPLKITHPNYRLDVYRDTTKPGTFGWEISMPNGDVILMDYDTGYKSFGAAETAGQWEFNAFIDGLREVPND